MVESMKKGQKRRALVLSGGSIKGAFQAGAIETILAGGVVPEAIYGISVGSLNGGFLVDRAGKAVRRSEQPDWQVIGSDLAGFWQNEIKSFKMIGKKRGSLSLLWQIIRSKFDGAIDTKRLRLLVNNILDEENLAAWEGIFKIGAVNVLTGELIQADKHNSPRQLRRYIIASTAIPFVMPPSIIGKSPYVDGGARDVATLRQAIVDGADEVYCVLCQEEKTSPAAINSGSIVEFGERIMEIVTNEMVNNDIDRAATINDLLAKGALKPEDKSGAGEYRQIDLKVIRPAGPLNIELTDFGEEDIQRLLALGREAAAVVMNDL